MYALIPTSSLCKRTIFPRYTNSFSLDFFLVVVIGGWNIYWPASHRICVGTWNAHSEMGKLEHNMNVGGTTVGHQTIMRHIWIHTERERVRANAEAIEQIKGIETISNLPLLRALFGWCWRLRWSAVVLVMVLAVNVLLTFILLFFTSHNLCIVQLVINNSPRIKWPKRRPSTQPSFRSLSLNLGCAHFFYRQTTGTATHCADYRNV